MFSSFEYETVDELRGWICMSFNPEPDIQELRHTVTVAALNYDLVGVQEQGTELLATL